MLDKIKATLENYRPDIADTNQSTKKAAVAVILRPAPGETLDSTEILFIKRAERDGDPWSGHMAFPGGHMEPDDSDWSGGRGFVTDYFEEHIIKKNNIDISDWQGYLCGPPPMVDAASSLLQKHGIKVDEIFYDKFTDSRDL